MHLLNSHRPCVCGEFFVIVDLIAVDIPLRSYFEQCGLDQRRH